MNRLIHILSYLCLAVHRVEGFLYAAASCSPQDSYLNGDNDGGGGLKVTRKPTARPPSSAYRGSTIHLVFIFLVVEPHSLPGQSDESYIKWLLAWQCIAGELKEKHSMS